MIITESSICFCFSGFCLFIRYCDEFDTGQKAALTEFILRNMPQDYRLCQYGQTGIYGWEPHDWDSREKWLTYIIDYEKIEF